MTRQSWLISDFQYTSANNIWFGSNMKSYDPRDLTQSQWKSKRFTAWIKLPVTKHTKALQNYAYSFSNLINKVTKYRMSIFSNFITETNFSSLRNKWLSKRALVAIWNNWLQNSTRLLTWAFDKKKNAFVFLEYNICYVYRVCWVNGCILVNA